VIGDDGIIMVDAELAPLHDKIKAAITENSSLPVRYLVDTHFHGEQTDAMHPSIATAPSSGAGEYAGTAPCGHHQRGQLQQNPPAHPDAIPTETYVGGTTTVNVRGREALLTHATNAHTDGDSWIYIAGANGIFTGVSSTTTAATR